MGATIILNANMKGGLNNAGSYIHELELATIRSWEKTDGDRNISFAKNLVKFAYEQKEIEANGFDSERDKMVIVLTLDISKFL